MKRILQTTLAIALVGASAFVLSACGTLPMTTPDAPTPAMSN